MSLRAWCAAVLCALLALPAVALEGPKWVSRVPPKYPREAVREKMKGCVTASFEITPEGQADHLGVVSSEPEGVFDEVALQSLRESRFEPGKAGKRYGARIDFGFEGQARVDYQCLDPELIKDGADK